MNYFDILLAKKLNGGGGGGDITVESLSVTENGRYTAPQGKAYSPVTVEVESPANSYQLKSITTPTSLATFEASEMPMPSLKVSVEAQQDLHGYDKPWVGGSGKNKLEVTATTQTVNGVTFTVNDDGTVTTSGTATATTILFIDSGKTYPSGSYILNGCPSGGGNSTYKLDVPNASYATDSGSGVTFNSDGKTGLAVRIVIYSGYGNNLTFKPMIRLATESDATFAPYSNICPISGWDNAIVTDTDDVDNPTVTQTTTIALGQTVYGGEVDVVNGVLKITDGYIASYNGETLPSTWISSEDVYAEGTTPTTGAEVCYELAEPIIINLTPSLIKSLNGQNNLSVDCGEILEGEYFKAL